MILDQSSGQGVHNLLAIRNSNLSATKYNKDILLSKASNILEGNRQMQ